MSRSDSTPAGRSPSTVTKKLTSRSLSMRAASSTVFPSGIVITLRLIISRMRATNEAGLLR